MCSKGFYKGHYILVFYDKTGEQLKYMFDNVRELLKKLGKEVTTENVGKMNVRLCRALKSEEHFIYMFDEVLRVYIVDYTE